MSYAQAAGACGSSGSNSASQSKDSSIMKKWSCV